MNGSLQIPTIDSLKIQAKRLRSELVAAGTRIGHSGALELLAHQHGFKDWNTLHAAVGDRPAACPVTLGERVQGNYLGQAFAGEVTGVQRLLKSDRYRITLVFDAPVDVVTFEGLPCLCRRVSCVIGPEGTTAQNTSDGRPHLILNL